MNKNRYKSISLVLTIGLLLTVISPLLSLAAQSDSTPPAEVGDLMAAAGDGKVTLTWKDPVDPDFIRIKIIGAGKTTYVDKGLQTAVINGLANDATYSFRLMALDTSGNLSAGIVIAATPKDTTPPDAVTELAAVIQNRILSVTWKDPVNSDLDRIIITGNNNTYYVDKGIQRLVIGGITDDVYGVYSVKSTDFSGNESAESKLTVVKDAEASVSLNAPSIVQQGKKFTVTAALSCLRQDVYAAEIKVKYSSDLFEFMGFREAGNDIYVADLTRTTPEGIRFFTISNKPITGKDVPIILLDFKARPDSQLVTGHVSVEKAMVGTAPDGYSIPAAVSGVNVAVTSGEDHTPPAEVTNLSIKADNGKFIIRWSDPADADFTGVLITGSGITAIDVAKGVQEKTIEGLENGKSYTFVIKTMDISGNESSGLSIIGRPCALGDINYDGVIDVADLAVFVYYYKVKDGDPLWEDARICDLTGTNGIPDGVVDILDLVLVASKIMNQ
jgi:hypothetical protein